MTDIGTHRYFAYLDGTYWRIQDLLHVDQIQALLEALEWKYPVFASIQSYDQAGNVISCPLFFDFDGHPDRVIDDTRQFVQACEFVINTTPRIYFSGSKGFHCTIQRPIHHARCHELCHYFAREVAGGLASLDHKVYRARSMFRIPCSPASKKGFYKIELTRTELFTMSFEEIRHLATNQRCIETAHDPSKIDDDAWTDWLAAAVRDLPTLDDLPSLREHCRSLDMEWTPCLETLLTHPPIEGERNTTVYVLAKFLKSCDVSEDAVEKLLLRYPHWRAFDKSREVSKVIRSVYRSKREAMVGCKGRSHYASLMRSVCDELCHFRDDFPDNCYTPPGK